MKRKLTTVAVATGVLALMGSPVLAQDGPTVETLAYDLDVVWVGIAAALVFLMQAGFALVESGLTRAKNAANIVAKNLADMSIGAVAYWAIGGALAYGATQGGFFGGSGFFFQPGAEGSVLGGDGVQFIFQLVFAATAATIVSGVVAERMKFAGYLIMSVFVTGLIYPIVTHWQWYGEGAWLYDLGYYDFAGSSLVHMTGAVAGLVGAAIIGPRLGKYGKDGKPRAIPGHNMPFAITGVFILWFGWFGFNGGSTLGAAGAGAVIGGVLTTTMLAGAAGGLAAGGVSWMVSKKPDPGMAGNGVLGGLVGITAAPDYAGTVAAVLLGLFCGAVVIFAVKFFDRIKIDDPVGAISVHGVCGAIGILAVATYPAARADGITFGTQLIGVLAIGAFVAVASALVFGLIRATVGVRVTSEQELEGLDVSEHGIPGYAPDVMAGAGTGNGSNYAFEAPGGGVAPTARPAEE